VLSRLHEERFQDRSPAAVYATLLDEGEYHCSIRTMYRLLEAHGEVRERRDQLTHPPYQKKRQDVLDVAYQRHPERFVRSAPKPPAPPSEVWINKPASTPEAPPVGAGKESFLGSDQLPAAIDFGKTKCAPRRDKNGHAVGPSSWRSSFLGDPDAKFLVEN